MPSCIPFAGFVSLVEASGATNAIVSCCLGTTTLLHIAQGEELQSSLGRCSAKPNYCYTLLKQQLSLCGLFMWNCVLPRRGTLQMQACGVLLGHPSPHRWPTTRSFRHGSMQCCRTQMKCTTAAAKHAVCQACRILPSHALLHRRKGICPSVSCFQHLESIITTIRWCTNSFLSMGHELSSMFSGCPTWPIRRCHLLHRRLAHARTRSERHLLSNFLVFIFGGLLSPTALWLLHLCSLCFGGQLWILSSGRWRWWCKLTVTAFRVVVLHVGGWGPGWSLVFLNVCRVAEWCQCLHEIPMPDISQSFTFGFGTSGSPVLLGCGSD